MYQAKYIGTGDAWEEDFPGSSVKWVNGQSREIHDSLVLRFENNPASWVVSGGSGYSQVMATANLTGGSIKTLWVGTQAEYDAIAVKDANTQYNTDAGIFVGETLVSGGGGGGLTTPLFVETLISCGMTAINSSVAGATLVVSGVAGQRSLTLVSGSVADFFNTNAAVLASPAVLEDSSGACWFVTVDQIVGGLSAVPGATIEIDDVLPVSVTNATLYNKHEGVAFGEHLSTAGYKALANHVVRQSPSVCALGNLQSVFSIYPEDDWDSAASPHAWVLGGTGGTKNLQHAVLYNNITGGNQGWVNAPTQRAHRLQWYNSGTVFARAYVPLDGINSGTILLEACKDGEYNTPVEITVHAITKTAHSVSPVITKTLVYTGLAYRNLRRLVIPFAAANGLEITVQRKSTDLFGGGINAYIGRLDVVVGQPNVSGRVVESGDTVLVMGDSWVDPLDAHAGFTAELSRLSGCSVVTGFSNTFPDASVAYVRTGQSGATTAYGLDWLQSALDANPSVNKVLLHYYVNDKNCINASTMNFTAPDKTIKDYNICNAAGVTPSVGNAINIWASNMQKLIKLCTDNGVQPIVIMPGSTFSSSSTATHAIMNYLIGQPSATQKLSVASAADLAKKGNPLNTRGKYTGKLVVNQSPGGASMLMYVANGPGNTDTWQQFGSATTVTPA